MTNQATRSKSLWVQGWTGINHSYAMVNQYQLLEMAKISDLGLYYSEYAYFNGGWSKDNVGSGFSVDDQRILQELRPHQGEPVDAIYRIHTPNTLELASTKVITFLVTEFGLNEKSFTSNADVNAYLDAGNLVVTPSNWSRDRIIEYGLTPESVFVVPHGVNGEMYRPLNSEERHAARSQLSYKEDDVVFLNVGAPLWNKGMDLLLDAFFKVRQKNKNARLLIKDQQALYGMTAAGLIQSLVAHGKITIDNDSVNAIGVIPKTLSQEQLRSLYSVADYYVSPYRAEGFNLPVIEAIACGTKVIVTDGGSTDDFCDANTSIKIPSKKLSNEMIQGNFVSAYLQPDLASLVEIMNDCTVNKKRGDSRLNFGRMDLLEVFTWKRAASLIYSLT
jgi:glycosyltransferase involved in cell wall biosynthesis